MARTRRVWIAVAIALAAAGLRATPAPQATATVVDLPKDVKKALDKRWKNWQLAPAPSSCPGDGTSSGPILDGDYNSDGTADVALAIATADGPVLAAAIVRMDDAEVYEVDKLPANGAVLSLGKRGTKYFRVGLTIDQYFGADALVLTPCGSTDAFAYSFTGSGFRRESIAQVLHN